jgi:anaphase-promoting complex subunit 1
VALLLGCAASHAGSGDAAVSRMLFLHLPARHPASYPEQALPSLVQSAALLSVGLLHRGTGNALMAEIALGEISRRLGGDALPDREGYSLAAGLALGLIALGKGRHFPALGGLRLEERLLRLMHGGPSQEAGGGGWEGGGGAAGAGLPGGGARLLGEELGGGGAGGGGGLVVEGSIINVAITAPGATLANFSCAACGDGALCDATVYPLPLAQPGYWHEMASPGVFYDCVVRPAAHAQLICSAVRGGGARVTA